MHIYRSDVYQNPKNIFYETEFEIKSIDDLRIATSYDYIPWKMAGKRCLENAIECDFIYHEYDNDHSDNFKEWVTIEKAQNEIYKGIDAYYLTSRNNYKPKAGKLPRPKFRVFMPCRKIVSVDKYNEYREVFRVWFPLCDHNALDAARFFYGFDKSEIEYKPGISILEWAQARIELENGEPLNADYDEKIYTEPEGKLNKGGRNAELKKYAGHIKFDFLDKTQDELFAMLWEWNLKHCEPPLAEKEIRDTVLKSTWKEIRKHREIRKAERQERGTTYTLDDVGDAEFLRDRLGKLYKWCDVKNCWLYFKDGVWNDDGNLIFIEECLKVFEERKAEIRKIKEVEAREEFYAHLGSLRNYKVYDRVLKAARSKMPVYAKEFNRDSYLLNCKNGTLNLKDFSFYEHRPEELHSKICAVEYKKAAAPPTIFLDFIETTFEGDLELINYVQKMLGFALTGDVSRQEFYIFHGDGGNGKSQLIATLQHIMGDYAYDVAAKRIMESKNNNNDTYLAQLRGIRALFCSEGGERARLDIALVKQLTDENASFNVAQKYEKPQQFKLSLHPFLITNPLPKIDENQDATWRRIRLIPFTHKVPPEKRILNFAAKMLEAGTSGIFNWYLEGLKKYYVEGLAAPEKVLAVTSKYKEKSDEIQQFIDDACEVGANFIVTVNSLLDAYKKWSGNKYIVARTFSPKLEEKGYKKTRAGNDRVSSFVGLRLLAGEGVENDNCFKD